ncbi:MAG: cupin domain-containing protein [Gammaproteobacteria bacterium]|nr:cupin domain-containing protein [Gammaproteobacteria bacterium]
MRLILIMLLASPSIAFADIKLGTREEVLNNEKVEVVRLTYPAGSESGLHTHIHPNRVVYFVKGGKLELIPENDNEPSKVLDVKDGQTLFLPATTHNVKNIGDTKIVIVETEIKRIK